MHKFYIIFLAILALITFPAHSSSAKIEKCIKDKNCEFFIFGALTPKPSMCVNVEKTSWNAFSKTERDELVSILREHIRKARVAPGKYAEDYAHINASAPIFPKIQQNISQINSFTIFEASKRHPERGGLLIGETVLEGNL